MNYKDIGIQTQAFHDSAPKSVNYWYGLREEKRQFDSLIKDSLESRQRRVALCRGTWGAGKTHVAYFYRNTLVLSDFSNALYDGKQVIVIESPKEGKSAFSDLYRRLISQVKWRTINQAVEYCIDQLGIERLFAHLEEVSENEDIAMAIHGLSTDDRAFYQRYLFGNATVSELKKYNLTNKPSTDLDYAHILAGLLYVLSKGTEGNRGSRVFIWIDEMEDLVYLRSQYYLAFTQALRATIDACSENITFVLNFTYSLPDDLSSINEVLGEALLSRIDSHITINEPSQDDIENYFLDLLRSNRPDEISYEEKYPFEEKAFSKLVAQCEGKTPRFCNQLLQKLLKRFISQADASLPISYDFMMSNISDALQDLTTGH